MQATQPSAIWRSRQPHSQRHSRGVLGKASGKRDPQAYMPNTPRSRATPATKHSAAWRSRLQGSAGAASKLLRSPIEAAGDLQMK